MDTIFYMLLYFTFLQFLFIDSTHCRCRMKTDFVIESSRNKTRLNKEHPSVSLSVPQTNGIQTYPITHTITIIDESEWWCNNRIFNQKVANDLSITHSWLRIKNSGLKPVAYFCKRLYVCLEYSFIRLTRFRISDYNAKPITASQMTDHNY